MKFWTMLFLSSVCSFAMAKKSDSIRYLPPGSRVKFLTDQIIPSEARTIFLGTKNKISCFLVMKESVEDTRLIRQSSEFEILFVGMLYPRVKVISEDIAVIYCKNPEAEDRELTISQFKNALEKVIKVFYCFPWETISFNHTF